MSYSSTVNNIPLPCTQTHRSEGRRGSPDLLHDLSALVLAVGVAALNPAGACNAPRHQPSPAQEHLCLAHAPGLLS